MGRRSADRFGTLHTEGCHSRFHARIAWLGQACAYQFTYAYFGARSAGCRGFHGKVTLSRFSLRSFIAIALLVVAVYVVFTQIQPAEMIKAVRDANLAMALVCVALGFVAWLGSAITLGVFMDSDKRNTIGLYCSQMASGFTAVSMPAGVGPAFVNLQFLRKSGYRSTAATAVMSAVWAVQEALPSCCC